MLKVVWVSESLAFTAFAAAVVRYDGQSVPIMTDVLQLMKRP
ncbi:hypothetical protein [Brevibacillus centrosporus]|nr:hypothetical protein [Brevibacillus centrosporus]